MAFLVGVLLTHLAIRGLCNTMNKDNEPTTVNDIMDVKHPAAYMLR